MHRANIRHCTLALALPNDVSAPIDGCTTMLTAKPHSHATCQHGNAVHYNIYQQHRSDTRAQLESHVDTQVTAKLLAQALKVEPPLVGIVSSEPDTSGVQRDCGLWVASSHPKPPAPRTKEVPIVIPHFETNDLCPEDANQPDTYNIHELSPKHI